METKASILLLIQLKLILIKIKLRYLTFING